MNAEKRAQEYIAAAMKRESVRMSAQMFGLKNEAWVNEQLTDAERSALAQEVGLIAQPEMPADEKPAGILPKKMSGAQRKRDYKLVKNVWQPHAPVQRGRQSK